MLYCILTELQYTVLLNRYCMSVKWYILTVVINAELAKNDPYKHVLLLSVMLSELLMMFF